MIVALGSAGVFALIEMLADVDDSRELADAIEEEPQVVVRPLGLQPERNLRVERLLRRAPAA